VISDPTAAVPRSDAQRRCQQIHLLLESMTRQKEKVLFLVTEAKEHDDHLALGYPSWPAYVSAEFTAAVTDLTRDDRRWFAFALSQTGLSTRAIAPIVGVDPKTVRNDLSGGDFSPPDLAGESYDSPAAEQEIQLDEQAFVEHYGMRPDIADGLISSGLVTNRKEFDEIADKIRDDPAPERTVVGLDGKRYAAKKRKAMRRPLPTAWQDALYQLGKDVERLERLAADDRFPGHKDDLSVRSRYPLASASKKLWEIRKALGGAE